MAYIDVFDNELSRGSAGMLVKATQEWLCYHGYGTRVDKDFGPATEVSVMNFQSKHKLPVTGKVDSLTWNALVLPAVNAVSREELRMTTFPEMIIKAAERNYFYRPREIGGENMGPWVRLYMQGKEGEAFPWCAGFASTVILQAFAGAGIAPKDFFHSMSCDVLVINAAKHGMVRKEPSPGALFFIRKDDNDWIHTGIVLECIRGGTVIRTIEGNTNDDGSREGWEVCSRVRVASGKDYVVFDSIPL